MTILNNIYAAGCLFSAVILLVGGCSDGLTYTISAKQVDMSTLDRDGWTSVGQQNISEMLRMRSPTGICKQNICGLQAGVVAAFLLKPREQFYNPNYPSYNAEYVKLGTEYPIIRPKEYPKLDIGLLPRSMSIFWTDHLKYHALTAMYFDDFASAEQKLTSEILAGRPLIVQVRVTSSGLPAILPDAVFGARTYWNAHFIVVLGFKGSGPSRSWLVRDNGGLYDVLTPKGFPSYSNVFELSTDDLKNALYMGSLAEDLHLAVDEPNIPIYLSDADPAKYDLREDMRLLANYNILVFTPR